MDVRHFVVIEFSHLANGCTAKCAGIGFVYIIGANICVGVCMQSVTLWLQGVQQFTRRPRTKMDVTR